MNEKLLKEFTDELLYLIAYHVTNNEKCISDIGTDYWYGRLFQSEEIHKEINKLIQKYKQDK